MSAFDTSAQDLSDARDRPARVAGAGRALPRSIQSARDRRPPDARPATSLPHRPTSMLRPSAASASTRVSVSAGTADGDALGRRPVRRRRRGRRLAGCRQRSTCRSAVGRGSSTSRRRRDQREPAEARAQGEQRGRESPARRGAHPVSQSVRRAKGSRRRRRRRLVRDALADARRQMIPEERRRLGHVDGRDVAQTRRAASSSARHTRTASA